MGDSFLTLVVMALATYRVAWMMAGERGPLDLFERWRDYLSHKFPLRADGTQHWIELGFNCPYCLGFWIAPALYGLWEVSELTRILVYILAISGLQVILLKKAG